MESSASVRLVFFCFIQAQVAGAAVSPVCPGSSLGPPPDGTPPMGSVPPQPAPFGVEGQRLYSELLLSDRALPRFEILFLRS